MASWKDSIPSNYLKASDFHDPRLLTIKRFTTETIGDDIRPCVWFMEEDKGLILNITNGNVIEEICGGADPADWVSRRIVLYATETDYKGKRVPCIRVRAPKQNAPAPTPPPPPAHDDSDLPF